MTYLILALIGGGLGYLAHERFGIGPSAPITAAVGAAGALIGGVALQAFLKLLGLLLGAAIGAAALLFLFAKMGNRRR